MFHTTRTTVSRTAVWALAGMLLLPGAAYAQPKADPDWPCVQRKNPTIDLNAVWSGPDPSGAGTWSEDPDASTLAYRLASRRTEISELPGLIDAFAKEAGPEAKTRLLKVMAGTLEIINTERDRLMHGIERYARGQRMLAEKVREESEKLSAAKDSPEAAETAQTKQLTEALTWDSRIFEERARSLSYVCETPVLMEQRAFEIGRLIQEKI